MKPALTYMPQLDALRAFAVACVLICHFVPFELQFGIPFGTIGVQTFFVLSGFLITSILMKNRGNLSPKVSIYKFYARRFLRIFPLYYSVLLVCYLASLEPIAPSIGWHLTYLGNIQFFLNNEWPETGSHFWSLCVEEQFYLVWPVLVLCASPRSLGNWVWGFFLFGVLCNVIGPVLFPEHRLLGVLPIMNFDSLGAGAILAYHGIDSQHKIQEKTQQIIVAVCLAILLGMSFAKYQKLPSLQTWFWMGRLSIIIISLRLIARGAKGFEGPIASFTLDNVFVQYLGKISYGIYVYHSFTPILVLHIANLIPSLSPLTSGVLGLAANTTLSILIAALSWHFFESPINRLKNRLT